MQPWVDSLLNEYQRDFPLHATPFSEISTRLGVGQSRVIEKLDSLIRRGVVSRVGPVFKPNTIGVSTLAAMRVRPDKLDDVAALVSACPEVNHNYEREHAYNLWFVATSRDQSGLDKVLDYIRVNTGFPVLGLPLLRDYHIDLGFRMNISATPQSFTGNSAPHLRQSSRHSDDHRNDEDLIAAIQSGIPLCERPFRDIADRLGLSEARVIAQLERLLEDGSIKRMGVIVRHHELGYRANAMVVWDIPDDQVDALGERLGSEKIVTLCYRRPRHRPEWPYNLFCMVHGKVREQVLESIDACIARNSLQQIPHEILFSGRRFKQRGARYRNSDG